MKNFAGQPDGGGEITILTGRDLMTNITPDMSNSIFQKKPLFVDNCKNSSSMKNLDAYGNNLLDAYGNAYENLGNPPKVSTFNKIFDVVKFGTGIWSNEQQRQSAEEQAQRALEIEQTRLAQERAKAASAQAQSSTVVGKIKAYSLPILITGVVVVGGIAAYFFFKKKKVN